MPKKYIGKGNTCCGESDVRQQPPQQQQTNQTSGRIRNEILREYREQIDEITNTYNAMLRATLQAQDDALLGISRGETSRPPGYTGNQSNQIPVVGIARNNNNNGDDDDDNDIATIRNSQLSRYSARNNDDSQLSRYSARNDDGNTINFIPDEDDFRGKGKKQMPESFNKFKNLVIRLKENPKVKKMNLKHPQLLKLAGEIYRGERRL